MDAFGVITVLGSFVVLDIVAFANRSILYGSFGMGMVIIGTAAIMEIRVLDDLAAGIAALIAIAFVSPSTSDWLIALAVISVSVGVAGVSSEMARRLRLAEFIAQRALGQERDRSAALLRSALPGPIADELERDGSVQTRDYRDATVMFVDIVGFTEASARVSSRALVDELNALFAKMDAVAERHGILKLKTIGDAYMTVAGLFEASPRTHLERTLQAAFAVKKLIRKHRSVLGAIDVRIGVHSGPLTAGVIGKERFAFDVWGDTVNLASRLEHASQPGQVNMTTATYARVAGHFEGHTRGAIEVKGKGRVHMTFVSERSAVLMPLPA
jgi:class 3 adenylate cyclase